MHIAPLHNETEKKGEFVKKFWALASFFILVVGFQNCSQSSLQQSGELSSVVSVGIPQGGAQPNGVASSEQAQVTYLEIPGVSDLSAEQQKVAAEEVDSRLVISLQSGRIQLMDGANSVLQTRCLKQEDLTELKTILAGSQICETFVAEDAICAMRIKSAYASLYANDKRVSLGAEHDSCGRGRKDLCGGLASVLQAYVSHVRSSWANMSCE